MSLEVKHLYKSFPSGKNILNGAKFKVEKGSFTFIQGESGAGKTTLFRMLAGLIKPSAGQVWVGGQRLRFDSEYSLMKHRQRLGLVFQDFKLLNHRSVLENISLPLLNVSEKSKLQDRVHKMIDELNLKDAAEQKVSTLSGGQMQRVALARALIHDPDYILADEPTGNLDAKHSEIVIELLHEASQRGKTVMVVSHDNEMIHMFGGEILTLKEGQVENQVYY